MTVAAATALLGGTSTAALLLVEFQRAAMFVPAYQTLLAEHGVRAADVRDLDTFTRVCPLLSKVNTFDRFPLADLCVGGRLQDVGEVLTSSGHGGRFSFGVISRTEQAAAAAFVDTALEAAFGVARRKTLALNCLPMGVGVPSRCMTVATTSVREDMAVALVKTFGSHYEQLVVIGDPLFLKRLTDHADEQALDWRRHHVNVIVGEETFGEHFRTYLAGCFGIGEGRILSSFGVAELGLHLCFETSATRALARELFPATDDAGWRPTLLEFDPQRTFLEIIDPGPDGYGRLAVSMLDPGRQVPLLRYQTGDVARLLEGPSPLLALRGRVRERLPNGAQVGTYKDAIYANPELARQLTGATRLVFGEREFTMHVQMVRGRAPAPALARALRREIPEPLRPSHVRLWRYAQFPFGMGLDYERKFQHYVPGDVEPGAALASGR